MVKLHMSSDKQEWNSRPLLVVLCAMIFSFLAWAHFCQIEEQIHATGRIVPASQAKTIQNLEGGIVEKILAVEGQTVKKDEPLMLIRNQRAHSDRDELRLSMEGLKIKRARLQAEMDDAKTFVYPETVSDELKATLVNEQSSFDSQTSLLQQKIAGLNEQISQKMLKLEDLKSQLVNLSAERDVSRDQLAINERLRKSGAISETRYLASVSQVKNFDTRIDQIKTTYPITKAEIEEIRKNIAAETNNFKSKVSDEMNDVEAHLTQSNERLKTATDEVSRTQVLSPVKGVVNKAYITTLGGVVKPGETLFEVTPFDDSLIVDARVSTKDRGEIYVGLSTLVKVTAYDYTIYGGLKGDITEISADSLSDEKGNRYYRVRIALHNATLSDKPLYPGMTVDASILTGKITLMNAMLKPLLRMRDNAFR